MNEAALRNKRILCADIGGSRVKAAILRHRMSLEELQSTPIIAFDSKEWLNEELPMLFCADRAGSLCQRMNASFDQICFGIKGPVRDGSLYVITQTRFPREIKRSCEEVAKCPVYVECDAGIWSRGAIYWQNLIHQEIPFPCLGVTLGTGAGVALLRSPHDIANIEISVLDAPFERLLEQSKHQPLNIEYHRPTPHRPIGREFFRWVEKECPFYDDDLIQKEFNRRVIAFLKDMEEYLAIKMGVQVQSFVVGGGNSRWIVLEELQKEFTAPMILLSPQNIARFGVSPDIISLLGCPLLPMSSPVEMIPSWDEILPWYSS